MGMIRHQRGGRLDSTLTVTITNRECTSDQCGCDATKHRGEGRGGKGAGRLWVIDEGLDGVGRHTFIVQLPLIVRIYHWSMK